MASGTNNVFGAALWMVGWFTATLAMTVAGRELGRDIPIFVLMMMRSLIATAILTPFVIANGGFAGRFSQIRLHIVRNILHYGGQYAWFAALLLIPLAEVISIEFTMPLWIAVLATLFLGEHMTRYKVAALIIGFAGVLLIVKPGSAGLQPGHFVALAAALLFSTTVTMTKFITRIDRPLTVIFLMFAIQSVIGAVPAYLTWQWPQPHNWIWVAVIGLAGTFSHFCLSNAISLADATIVMPMDFIRLPLTALAGWLLYQEGIDLYSVAGALLILAANTVNLAKAKSA
jgi:drug/metabolite transporter (DMT)-like permease